MIFKGYTFQTLEGFEELIVTLKQALSNHDVVEFTTSKPVGMKDNSYGFIWPVIEGEETSLYEMILKPVYGEPKIITSEVDFVPAPEYEAWLD